MDSCRGRDHLISRRRMLFSSGLAGAYLAAAGRADAQWQERAVTPRSTAKACVFINMSGAPSQLDTFDSKDGPWNPADINLQQHAPGMVLSKTYFPNLSSLMGDMVLIHSAASWEAAHERGQFYIQTAHPSNPAFVAESPHVGSVLTRELGAPGPLPPFLMLNAGGGVVQGAKFLGGLFEPFNAPANAGGLATLEHNFYGNTSQTRFNERFQLLADLDRGLRQSPYSQEMAAHAEFYGVARRMMYDPAIANVFKFSTDDDARYGRTSFGRSCIVARNAIRAKAGVSFINIQLGGWDMHQSLTDPSYAPNIYSLGGDLDRGVGNLAKDLKESGDLGSTLIVMMGEFGRTPGALNPQGGRDHYKSVMSVAVMGGGVKGGRALGTTDAQAANIVDPGWSGNRPVYIEDITATIYSALGVNWTKAILDTPSGRKFEYVPGSWQGSFKPVEELFG